MPFNQICLNPVICLGINNTTNTITESGGPGTIESFIIPANQLKASGDTIVMKAVIQYTAGTGSTTNIIYFEFADQQLASYQFSALGGNFTATIEFSISYTGPTTARVSVEAFANAAYPQITYGTGAVLDFSSSQTFDIYAQLNNSGDSISGLYANVQYLTNP